MDVDTALENSLTEAEDSQLSSSTMILDAMIEVEEIILLFAASPLGSERTPRMRLSAPNEANLKAAAKS